MTMADYAHNFSRVYNIQPNGTITPYAVRSKGGHFPYKIQVIHVQVK
jgi:hypothetical protein